MPYEELLGWLNYFERRPPDWRDDDRTFKLLQVQGVKEKPQSIFPSLKAIYSENKPAVKEDGKIDPDAFKRSSVFNLLLGAKNGDKITL